ncbi:MAG: hypothetical protein GY820_18545, partial [Gammaproteobacteria bacterium]|nr:hypothetical protein [Gammaproteobacteria bacterium]
PEEAALILAHQSTEPVTGTAQKSEEKFEPEVIVSPKGETASDPNVKEGDSDTSSHHPLEGDGEDPVTKRQRENSQSSGGKGKKADSTMEDLGKLSLSQDEGENKGADAHKGEGTTVDGINVIPMVDQEPPLPKTRPVGAKGKRAKAAEKKRQKRAQRLAAALQPPGEAGASASVDPEVMIMEDDLSNSTEQLTTSGTGSEGEQEDQVEEQAEEATEGQEQQKGENMEE